MGLEVVIGALVAWAIAKARRAGGATDEIVDEAIDAGMEKVHDVVMAKLGQDPALTKLEIEAATSGDVTPRTRQRAELAIADAIDEDPGFADELRDALAELAPPAAEPLAVNQSVSGTVHGANVMIGGSVGGNVHIAGKPEST
jgi:hypothetical protein